MGSNEPSTSAPSDSSSLPSQPMWSGARTPTPDPYRTALRHALALVCKEVGFQAVTSSTMETLSDLAASYMSELGRSAQAYAELANRTSPMISDVSSALVEMGTNVGAVANFKKTAAASSKSYRRIQLEKEPKPDPARSKLLEVDGGVMGPKRPLPTYAPSYLPPLPDRHTYLATPARRTPLTDYRVARERSSNQQRDIQVALTRFIAKTSSGIKGYQQPNRGEDDTVAIAVSSIVGNVSEEKSLLPQYSGGGGGAYLSQSVSRQYSTASGSVALCITPEFPLISPRSVPRSYLTSLLEKVDADQVSHLDLTDNSLTSDTASHGEGGDTGVDQCAGGSVGESKAKRLFSSGSDRHQSIESVGGRFGNINTADELNDNPFTRPVPSARRLSLDLVSADRDPDIIGGGESSAVSTPLPAGSLVAPAAWTLFKQQHQQHLERKQQQQQLQQVEEEQSVEGSVAANREYQPYLQERREYQPYLLTSAQHEEEEEVRVMTSSDEGSEENILGASAGGSGLMGGSPPVLYRGDLSEGHDNTGLYSSLSAGAAMEDSVGAIGCSTANMEDSVIGCSTDNMGESSQTSHRLVPTPVSATEDATRDWHPSLSDEMDSDSSEGMV